MANNQAKKVLIFSTAYLPLVGGAEIAVNEITKRLPGWQFDLITARIDRSLKKEERINNINIYRVGFGSNFDKYKLPFLGLKKAIELEKKNNYSLTWSIMASYGGFLGLRFKNKYPDKPWLLTLQEGDDPEYILKRVGIFKKWFYQIFEKADYFQAISHFLYKWAVRNGANKGEVVPNGVDLNKFERADQKTIDDLKNKLKIKENEKVILTVSRLVKKNGVDDLIKAGQYLNFSFKILIIGIGEQRKELDDLTRKLKMEDKVIFLGYVDYGNLSKYYSLADVFIRASRSEGFGNVFLESLACGTPIIGTETGGIVDFLENKKNGLFCKMNNPEDIAKQIKKCFSSEINMSQMVNNGQELIKRKYDWNIIAEKMEKIF